MYTYIYIYTHVYQCNSVYIHPCIHTQWHGYMFLLNVSLFSISRVSTGLCEVPRMQACNGLADAGWGLHRHDIYCYYSISYVYLLSIIDRPIFGWYKMFICNNAVIYTSSDIPLYGIDCHILMVHAIRDNHILMIHANAIKINRSNRSINQSTNQLINQSINQSIRCLSAFIVIVRNLQR